MGGIQVRGKNAATLQLLYMIVIACVNTIKLMWHITILTIWYSYLLIRWIIDFTFGFVRSFEVRN